MLQAAVLFTGVAAVLILPLIRKTAWGRAHVPSWAGLGVLVPALPVSLALWLADATPEQPSAATGAVPFASAGPDPSSQDQTRWPLLPGEKAPPLTAGGWVNGDPPAVGRGLVVVDFWAAWCPYCAKTAPDLGRVHAKYAPRGVAFVGMSNQPRAAVASHLAAHSVPYPSGYDVPRETLEAFGVGTILKRPVTGYEIAPTLYLIGPDGVVKWTDKSARFRHKEPAEIAEHLDAAIAKELAALPR
jgi:peroxiredoxin